MKILSLLNGRLLAIMFALSGLIFITSCGDDDEGDDGPTPTQTIWEIVQERTELSSLEAELDSADLEGTLGAAGSMTLFAPSNAALTTLLGTLGLEDFSTVSEAVTQAVLTYHVANQEILAEALADGNTITTLQGEDITVIAGPQLSTGATSDAGFVETDILATNGVVHIVDVVLVPPTIGALIVSTLGTVAQPILLGGDFTTLAGAIQKADTYAATSEQIPSLITTLSTPAAEGGSFTVFAPVNDVFTAGGITLDTFTAEEWYGIISNHVSGTIYEPADLVTGLEIATLLPGSTVTVTNAGQGGTYTSIFLESTGDATFDAEIALPNAAVTGNGVVHAIAGVLSPAQ